MNTLEYNFSKKLDAVDIDDYLISHHKTKNVWWKTLKGIGDEYNRHLNFLKENANNFFNNGHSTEFCSTPKTAKSCPAIGNGVLNKSHLVLAPCDIFLRVRPDNTWFYQTPVDGLLDISSHSQYQFHTKDENIFKNYINIKFEFPLLVSTNKNPYIFLEPQYHNPNFEMKILQGAVEDKYTKAQPLNINTLIKITDEDRDIFIKKGEVLCYLWSPQKLNLKENKKLIIKPKLKFF